MGSYIGRPGDFWGTLRGKYHSMDVEKVGKWKDIVSISGSNGCNNGTTLVTGYKSHKVITKKRMCPFLDETKLVHTPIPTQILPFKAF